MQIDEAIRRAKHDAAYYRKEARRYEREGMPNSAKLAERDAEMLEALIEAAKKGKRYGN